MKKYAVLSTRAIFFKRNVQPGLLLLLLAVLLCCLTACGPTEGIFAGGNWQASGLSRQKIQVLVTDPTHLENIYAGDQQAGVFASTDAGLSWKQSNAGLPQPADVYALAFDTSGKKVYAATSAGLFVSSDSTASWNAVRGVPVNAYTALAFDLNSPQTLYVGAAHAGVLKSIDGGTTWTQISHGLPTDSALTSLLYDPTLKQLWAVFPDALYRSDNGGTVWQAMDNGLPAHAGLNALAQGTIVSGTDGPLFLATDHGFFLSTDDGQHWLQSKSSLAALRIFAILPDATQLAMVYIATSIGVLHSQDNGQTWASVAGGLPDDQAFLGLTQGGASYSQLLVGARGVYRYPGNGSIFDFSRLLPILLVLLFFAFLYRFLVMKRRAVRPSVASQGDILPDDQTQKGSLRAPEEPPDGS